MPSAAHRAASRHSCFAPPEGSLTPAGSLRLAVSLRSAALPPVVGLLADVMTCAHVPHLHPTLRLAQDAHDLLFNVSALFHGVLLSWFRSQNYILQPSYFQGPGHTYSIRFRHRLASVWLLRVFKHDLVKSDAIRTRVTKMKKRLREVSAVRRHLRTTF